MSIGELENTESPSFLNRIKSDIPKCTEIKHKWAEIKTSLLMQELVSNTNVYNQLTRFMNDMTDRLSNVLGYDRNTQLNTYLNELETAVQFSQTRQYPVAQSVAWKQNPSGLSNNFYGMLNYVKWMWLKLMSSDMYYNPSDCKSETQRGRLAKFMIITFQQNFFAFIQTIRGNRLDLDQPYGGIQVTDQIGIGSFFVPRLKRVVKNRPGFEPEPWNHAGKKCFVPYWGKYGELMQQYNNNNEYFGSVQCGISASTQYMLFMYLLSSVESPPQNIMSDLRNLITTECLQLAGDGGHNVREILFGITSTATLFNALIVEVNNELEEMFHGGSFEQNVQRATTNRQSNWNGVILASMFTFIGSVLDTLCIPSIRNNDNVWLFFTQSLNVMLVWQPVITALYQLTNDINICGVTEQNIKDAYNINTQTELEEYKRENRTQVLRGLFNPNKDVDFLFGVDSLNTIQSFHGLDNNRYLLDVDTSFKNIANTKIIQIINMFGDQSILNNVNLYLEEELQKCPTGRPVPENAVNIPFAFESSAPKFNYNHSKSKESCVIL